MKVRSDFVTNSSSSSFVSMSIESPLLAKMLEDYKAVLEERGELPGELWDDCYLNIPFTVQEGSTIFAGDEELGAFEDVPESLEDAFRLFCETIEQAEFDSFLSDEAKPKVGPLVRTLWAMQDEILSDIESVDWHYMNSGWGGDSEVRFDPEWFPKESADAIWAEIAEEKGVPVGELTQEDWGQHVSGEVSVEKSSFSYDRRSGKSMYERTVGLNDW